MHLTWYKLLVWILTNGGGSMENNDIAINLGKRIRENRQFRHITGEQFCNEVGISQTFLWDIENGHKKPSLETLIKMVNVLQCPVEDLLCDSLKGAVYAHQHNLSKKLVGLDKEQIKFIETTIDSLIVALRKDARK